MDLELIHSIERLDSPKGFALIVLKPDAVSDSEKNVKILTELIKYGKIKHLHKQEVLKKETARKHYSDAEGKKHFPFIVEYMSSKKVTFFVLEEKENTIELINNSFSETIKKVVVGKTIPEEAEDNTIRALARDTSYKKNILLDNGETGQIRDNLVHCSDDEKEALREIKNLYSSNKEVCDYYQLKYDKYDNYTKKQLNKS